MSDQVFTVQLHLQAYSGRAEKTREQGVLSLRAGLTMLDKEFQCLLQVRISEKLVPSCIPSGSKCLQVPGLSERTKSRLRNTANEITNSRSGVRIILVRRMEQQTESVVDEHLAARTQIHPVNLRP